MQVIERNFSKFGKGFQENLCHIILDDRPFADQMFEVLEDNFLELAYLRVFVKKIRQYKDKYGVHPSRDAMKMIVRSGIKDEQDSVQKLIRDYYARVLSGELQVGEVDFIKDTALDFCKKQKLQEAMMKSIPLLESSSFEEIAKNINEAIKLGTSNDVGYD